MKRGRRGLRPSVEGRELRKGVEVVTLDHALDDLASLDQLGHDGADLLTGRLLDGGNESAQVRDGVGHTLDHSLGNLVADVGIGDLRLGGLVALDGVALLDGGTQGNQLVQLLGGQVGGVLNDLRQDRNVSDVSTHSVHFLSCGRSQPFIQWGLFAPLTF